MATDRRYLQPTMIRQATYLGSNEGIHLLNLRKSLRIEYRLSGSI